MTLTQYVKVLRQHWLIVVILTALGLAAAIGWTSRQTPMYQAQTQVFVSVQGQGGGDDALSELSQSSTFSQQRVKSYASMATTSTVTDPVIRDLRLPYKAAGLAAKIEASPQLDTVLIDITATDADPQVAAAIANSTAGHLQTAVNDLESNGGRNPSTVMLTVTRPALAPTEPVSPRVPLNIALGLLLGLGLGVGAAVLRDQLNTTLRGSSDIEQLTGSVPLGVVPFDAAAPKQPLVTADAFGGRAEAFRTLRTNLQFADVDHPPRVIAVTSALPDEGKTTTACNIALILAQSGARVVLVEGDLRKPAVGKYLGISNAVGLTNVLAGQHSLRDVVVGYERDLLAVLPSGPTPPNPSELLGSQQMRHLLDTLAEHYDVVVVDAPPLLPVTDAALIATAADGAILVIRHGRSRREEAERALKALEAVSAKVLGTVLNFAPRKKGRNGYQGYGYGYGQPPAPTPAPAVSSSSSEAVFASELASEKKSRRGRREKAAAGPDPVSPAPGSSAPGSSAPGSSARIVLPDAAAASLPLDPIEGDSRPGDGISVSGPGRADGSGGGVQGPAFGGAASRGSGGPGSGSFGAAASQGSGEPGSGVTTSRGSGGPSAGGLGATASRGSGGPGSGGFGATASRGSGEPGSGSFGTTASRGAGEPGSGSFGTTASRGSGEPGSGGFGAAASPGSGGPGPGGFGTGGLGLGGPGSGSGGSALSGPAAASGPAALGSSASSARDFGRGPSPDSSGSAGSVPDLGRAPIAGSPNTRTSAAEALGTGGISVFGGLSSSGPLPVVTTTTADELTVISRTEGLEVSHTIDLEYVAHQVLSQRQPDRLEVHHHPDPNDPAADPAQRRARLRTGDVPEELRLQPLRQDVADPEEAAGPPADQDWPAPDTAPSGLQLADIQAAVDASSGTQAAAGATHEDWAGARPGPGDHAGQGRFGAVAEPVEQAGDPLPRRTGRAGAGGGAGAGAWTDTRPTAKPGFSTGNAAAGPRSAEQAFPQAGWSQGAWFAPEPDAEPSEPQTESQARPQTESQAGPRAEQAEAWSEPVLADEGGHSPEPSASVPPQPSGPAPARSRNRPGPATDEFEEIPPLLVDLSAPDLDLLEDERELLIPPQAVMPHVPTGVPRHHRSRRSI
ncbi:polysaccharide biosynthesis tyrosine autokinase [Kineosporia babensis]|uniref:non-specific protein-tyrosine kinase n=1 Tax=Kineosporia babensis TaxID=499548 RepID=A0A9X1NBL5_9ACTN|nr:polysaccharide biosynthesis tyrosine autokinase [Kineosporia babensis]MCD5310068.1 polysaccharide biosynthesis tyrosine autokinase [Kineosporia babensis]